MIFLNYSQQQTFIAVTSQDRLMIFIKRLILISNIV